MWCLFTCIVVRLKPPWKTRSLSPTAGVVTRPGDKKPGRSWLSGSGTSAWSWGIDFRLNRCAPPSLHLPSHRSMSTRPRVRPHLLPPRPPRGMRHLPPLLPGKLAASPVQTFHSNLMGPFGVQQATSWSLMSDVKKSMAVCASSMPPAFATAARVRYVSNVNGTVAQRPNRARSACCSIPWQWDRLRCGYARLEQTTPAAGMSPLASSTPRHPERTSPSRPQNLCSSHNLSGRAGTLPFVLGGAAGSQCPIHYGWSAYIQTLRYPRTLCKLARSDRDVGRTRSSSTHLVASSVGLSCKKWVRPVQWSREIRPFMTIAGDSE